MSAAGNEKIFAEVPIEELLDVLAELSSLTRQLMTEAREAKDEQSKRLLDIAATMIDAIEKLTPNSADQNLVIRKQEDDNCGCS